MTKPHLNGSGAATLFGERQVAAHGVDLTLIRAWFLRRLLGGLTTCFESYEAPKPFQLTPQIEGRIVRRWLLPVLERGRQLALRTSGFTLLE